MKMVTQIQFPREKWRESKEGKNRQKIIYQIIWKDFTQHNTGPKV